MRPLRLDMAGFAVFRDPTTVDFTDTDFFALVGPTGAGKSTVLDAICFALYGTVPRWGDRRAIANALAPSASEARVRLVFESSGDRYVAARVVRRDGKGRVSTSQAGLELLPAGFDLRRFDTGLEAADLGEVLAGTPAEMEPAVLAAVGLPYEQFVTCVVLPQGEFAEFLHAKPATRQQILVNLLGLSVYERVRERAGALAAAADAQVQAVDRLLADLSDVDSAGLDDAAALVTLRQELVVEMDTRGPWLAAAQDRVKASRQALATLDAELTRLRTVIPPAEHDTLTRTATSARAAALEARTVVAAAEEREEKLRGELATGPDPAVLRRLLDGHTERERLARQMVGLDEAVASATVERTAAATALAAAQTDATRAGEVLDAARRAYQLAQATDRAAALRVHLVAGEPCPVCAQPVHELPPPPTESTVAEAQAAGQDARAAAEATAAVVAERDRTVRDLDLALTAAQAQRDQLAAQLSELDGQLAAAPGVPALHADLATIAARQKSLDEATSAVRAAREAHRRAAAADERAETQVRAAWRGFDTTRDSVAALNPPATDRDDLAASWIALADWAWSEVDKRTDARSKQAREVVEADKDVASMGSALRDKFASVGVAAPRGVPDAAAYARAAAVALERAEAEHRRLVERGEQVARLREQRAAHEREAQVAKALAQHLRANYFERWLLEEALDALVDGASRILRELSSGQYDLGHDKGEFYVVDHHDAGLRRAVRTLSGGETFQASLALALALSEQLAGMSSATASLESIMLDEGFGTLDTTTLDTVTATLENLAARGDRMVGVVTHVNGLAERIPVRFEVRKDARTAYVERVGLL
jgi:exonuclease SbcC